MTDKPKLAMYWAAACGGCEIAVLNIHEKILDVDANFDVVFWPVAMDAKYKDVEAMPDASITLTLFNGAIRNDENEHLAHLLRRKSKLLVAFGACACEGGLPALTNLSQRRQIFDAVYHTPSTDEPDGNLPRPNWSAPEGELHIPELYPVVKTLDQIVPVDYYMPGCPPESHQIAAVIDVVIQALQGKQRCRRRAPCSAQATRRCATNANARATKRRSKSLSAFRMCSPIRRSACWNKASCAAVPLRAAAAARCARKPARRASAATVPRTARSITARG